MLPDWGVAAAPDVLSPEGGGMALGADAGWDAGMPAAVPDDGAPPACGAVPAAGMVELCARAPVEMAIAAARPRVAKTVDFMVNAFQIR